MVGSRVGSPLVVSDARSLVDLDRYPVGDPDGAGRETVTRHATELRDTGVSILPGFLRAHSLQALVAECDALADGAHHQDVHGTPYLELPEPSDWPADHPRVTWSRSSVHTVAYDRFEAGTSALRALFEWDDLLVFVGRILGREPLYRYADPLGAMNLAVMVEGDELGWHYDQTDFVVSLALQSSDGGGEFESVQRLRWDGGDSGVASGSTGAIAERYDEVAAVLAGDAAHRVTTVPMTPGTLMLFEGRRSLHRVTTVTGSSPRYVALFGYDTKPGTMSSELLKLVRYGRAA